MNMRQKIRKERKLKNRLVKEPLNDVLKDLERRLMPHLEKNRREAANHLKENLYQQVERPLDRAAVAIAILKIKSGRSFLRDEGPHKAEILERIARELLDYFESNAIDNELQGNRKIKNLEEKTEQGVNKIFERRETRKEEPIKIEDTKNETPQKNEDLGEILSADNREVGSEVKNSVDSNEVVITCKNLDVEQIEKIRIIIELKDDAPREIVINLSTKTHKVTKQEVNEKGTTQETEEIDTQKLEKETDELLKSNPPKDEESREKSQKTMEITDSMLIEGDSSKEEESEEVDLKELDKLLYANEEQEEDSKDIWGEIRGISVADAQIIEEEQEETQENVNTENAEEADQSKKKEEKSEELEELHLPKKVNLSTKEKFKRIVKLIFDPEILFVSSIYPSALFGVYTINDIIKDYNFEHKHWIVNVGTVIYVMIGTLKYIIPVLRLGKKYHFSARPHVDLCPELEGDTDVEGIYLRERLSKKTPYKAAMKRISTKALSYVIAPLAGILITDLATTPELYKQKLRTVWVVVREFIEKW